MLWMVLNRRIVSFEIVPAFVCLKSDKMDNKKDNNGICSSKDVEQDFKRMFFIVAIMAMICVVIYKFTGITFIWLII